MSSIRIKETPPTKAGLGTKLFRAGFILVVLLLALYFVVSSSWFLKSVVMPRVGAALNSKLIVGDITLRPFAELTIDQIKLTPNGAETLFTAKKITAKYSLLAIIRGNLKVDEVIVDSPVVTIVQNANGGSNLDALSAGNKSEAQPQPAAKSGGSAPRLNIKSVAVRNASFRQTKVGPNNEQTITEVANVNLNLSNLKNGEAGKLSLSAALALDQATAASVSVANLQALLNVEFAFNLLDDLKPGPTQGVVSFSVGRATGELAELGGLIAKLDCETTATEVKKLALKFNKGETALGEVRISGPFDTSKLEGRLKMEILAIDRRVLNLVGAASGIDFGSTAINGVTDISVTQGGRMISPVGRLDVTKLQVIQQGRTSPTLDFSCAYDLTFDRGGNSLLLKALNLSGAQNAAPVLKGALNSPMVIPFGDAVNAADGQLDLSWGELNLADWRGFMPDLDLGGAISGHAKVLSRSSGQQLIVEIENNVKSLHVKAGADPISVGSIAFKGDVAVIGKVKTVKGTLGVNELKLAAAGGAPLQVALGLDVGMTNQLVALRNCSLQLTPTARATNALTLSGQVDLTKPAAITGSLKLAADALDFTDYYDLFAGKPSAAKPAAPATSASNAPAKGANAEPDAVTLPLANFTAEASINRLYLHEIDAAKFQTTVLLDHSHVLLKPFQLSLNQAPVSASADLDLSKLGWKYDVAFSADGIPVEPLANTFSPTYRGQAKGTLLANASIKGAGVTGVNMRSNLIGKVDFSFTNANIQLAGPKLKAVLTPIALALNVPDILRSPLDYVTAGIVAGDGKITIANCILQSPTFQASSVGAIPIADVLNDSPLKQPVDVSLSRSVAKSIGYASASTEAAYVTLPNFVQLTGTLGNPEPKIDKTKLAGVAAVGIGSALLKNVGGDAGQKAGGALNTLGELLGGKPAATNAPAAGTNNVATNQPAKPNLFNTLRGLTK